MPAYVLIDVHVTDPESYKEYLRLGDLAMAKHGGRFLARGGNPQTLEGAWPTKRVVIIEFADRAAALRWYHSPEYALARKAREGAAEFRAIVVDGAMPERAARAATDAGEESPQTPL